MKFFAVVLPFKICSFVAMNSSEQKLNRCLHAIADPTRRRILQALKERGACSIGKDVGLCASDIELRIHLSQPTISHHLRILADAGVLSVREAGQHRFISINRRVIRELALLLPARLTPRRDRVPDRAASSRGAKREGAR